jgi:hypothetical protein
MRLRLRVRIERLLRKWCPRYKHIGWREIGEKFTRYTLFECQFFTVYLHKLTAPTPHAKCHNHPWNFWAVLLWGGYWESVDGGPFFWRHPLSVLYRPARFTHNVITPPGKTNWSICIMSPKKREWGFKACRHAHPLLAPPAGHASDPAP